MVQQATIFAAVGVDPAPECSCPRRSSRARPQQYLEYRLGSGRPPAESTTQPKPSAPESGGGASVRSAAPSLPLKRKTRPSPSWLCAPTTNSGMPSPSRSPAEATDQPKPCAGALLRSFERVEELPIPTAEDKGLSATDSLAHIVFIAVLSSPAKDQRLSAAGFSLAKRANDTVRYAVLIHISSRGHGKAKRGTRLGMRVVQFQQELARLTVEHKGPALVVIIVPGLLVRSDNIVGG